MSLISATLGRLSPRYKTLAQWAKVYEEILAKREICGKTRANRRTHSDRIVRVLGRRTISSIRPHEIAAIISSLVPTQPHTAARTLVEAKDIFNEALQAGWVDSNPALDVKTPRVRIARRRLDLDQWQRIHDYADCCSPPWVARMMVLALVTGQRRSDLLKMRFSDVKVLEVGGLHVEYLHVEQQKTGARVAIPLALRLAVIDTSVAEAIAACRGYAALDADGDGYMIRKTTTAPLAGASSSWRFQSARDRALGPHSGKGTAPSLHECRSLSERLYRKQGINTMVLLGHTQQRMTDMYNNDRGLSAKEWKVLAL